MAYQVFEASSGYGSYFIRLQLILASSSNGSSANSSTLNYWLRWTKINNDGAYAYSNGNHVWLTINGDPIVATNSWGRVDISGLTNGQYIEFASGTKTIAHNSDGTKSIPVYARFYQSQRSDCDFEINGTFTLDTIPRYPIITLSATPTSPSTINVTATVKRDGSNLNCRVFNFQYCEKGKSWAACDGGPGDDKLGSNSPAGYYTNQNVSSKTHTYKNLKYYTEYTFRCLVITSDGVEVYTTSTDSSGNLSARTVTATTLKPSLMTLGTCVLDPTSSDNIQFNVVSHDSGTRYAMSVRVGSSSGAALSDGTYTLEDGSNRYGSSSSEFSRMTTAAAWNRVFYPAYKTTTKGKLWIRIATYSLDSNTYMGENSYIKEVDFSGVDLSPVLNGTPTIDLVVPSGLSALPSGYTVTGKDGGMQANWTSDMITLKGGATLQAWKIVWNETETSLSTSTLSYRGYATKSGNNTFKLTAVDSRGKTCEMLSSTIPIIEYHVPEIQFSVARQGYNTNVVIYGKCKIAPVIVDGVAYNAKTIVMHYRTTGADEWIDIELTPTDVDDNGYFSLDQVVSDAFDLSSTYEVESVVTDTAGSNISKIWNIPTAVITFGITDNGAMGVNCYPEDGYFLTVNGNGKIIGDLDITGSATINNNTTINGNLTIDGDIHMYPHDIYLRDIISKGWYYFQNDSFTNGLGKLARDSTTDLIIGDKEAWATNNYHSGSAHRFSNSSKTLLTMDSGACVAHSSVAAYFGENRAGQFYAIANNSSPSFLIRNDGSDTWFMFTNSNDILGAYNDLRPMRINNSNGKVYFGQETTIQRGRGLVFTASASNDNFPHIVGNGTMLCLGPTGNNVYDVIIGNSGIDGGDSYSLRPSIQNGVSGHVHLGTATYRWRNIYSATSVNVSSDRRMKKDIEYISYEDSINFIKALKPAQYKYIDGDSGRTHRGLIAQDVEDSFEELGITSSDFAGFIKSPIYETKENENGEEISTNVIRDYNYSLRYDEFESDLINAVKYLLEEVEKLKNVNN